MSENKKNIDQLINESFKSSDFDFDDSSWSNVKNKLDKSTTVDKIVFSALNPTHTKLPDDAWKSMNDALDIETVWKRLAARKKKKPIAFWWKTAAVFLLLLITTHQLLNFTTKNVSKSTVKINNTEETNTPKNEINKKVLFVKSAPNNNKKKYTSSISNNSIDETKQSYTKNKEGIKLDTKKDIYINNEISEIEKIVKIKSKEITSLNIHKNCKALELAQNSFDSIIFPPSSKLTVGLIALTENTWVSDAYTRSGFSKNSLIFNDLVFTPTIGVFARYSLSNNYGIGAEFYMNSVQKTRNNLFINGDLTKREIKIEYIKTNISISKMIPIGYRNKLHTLDLSGGVYLSYLKKSSLSYIARTTSSIEVPNYAKIDYGLTLNIGHQINLKKFVFGYGLHTNYGLNNIFKGNSEIPKLFNQTRNFAYGVQLKFGYKF